MYTPMIGDDLEDYFVLFFFFNSLSIVWEGMAEYGTFFI